MAFFQELHDVGSGHHEEDTFTIQKLLYPTDSSKGDRTGSLPSHSSLQAADSFSKPALLKDLYDDITMVLFIFGTMRQEDRPNCMTIITCDNAKEIEKLLYGHKIDLWVIDSLLKSTGNGELYAELFRAVAEIIFLYYKIIKALPKAQDDRIKYNPAIEHPILEERINDVMQLLRLNAPRLGFSAEGYDRWNEADYVIIFHHSSSSEKSKAVGKAIQHEHTTFLNTLEELSEAVVKVKKGEIRVWTKDMPHGDTNTKSGKMLVPEAADGKGN